MKRQNGGREQRVIDGDASERPTRTGSFQHGLGANYAPPSHLKAVCWVSRNGTAVAPVLVIMSEPRGLRFQEQVDRPYATVRDLLYREPLAVLQRATTSAVSRANSPVATLHARVGGVEISVDVRVRITRTRDQPPASGAPVTRLDLSLQATSAPALFPEMLAELSARPVSANETLLELDGSYWLPMGALGAAIDAAVGHRVAEAVVRRLLADLAAQIRAEVAPA